MVNGSGGSGGNAHYLAYDGGVTCLRLASSQASVPSVCITRSSEPTSVPSVCITRSSDQASRWIGLQPPRSSKCAITGLNHDGGHLRRARELPQALPKSFAVRKLRRRRQRSPHPADGAEIALGVVDHRAATDPQASSSSRPSPGAVPLQLEVPSGSSKRAAEVASIRQLRGAPASLFSILPGLATNLKNCPNVGHNRLIVVG